MKHCLSLFTVIVLSVTFSYAQNLSDNWRVGFGINAGIPTTDVFKNTLGGDIRLEKGFGNCFSGTLSAGFTHFFEKDHFEDHLQYGSPYNVIPVKAGIKAFLIGDFYVAAEAGAGFGFEQWDTSFLYSPSLGLTFKNGLDIGVKYEDFTKDKATKDVALRLGYSF